MQKILFIESNPLLRNFWVEVFKKEGLQIFSAKDEIEALSQARLSHPDLIFLGSNMDGMRGVHFMARMKSEQLDLLVVAPVNTLALLEKLKTALNGDSDFPKIHVEKVVYAVQEALKIKTTSLFDRLSITEMERRMIEEALKRSNGNQSQAARLLGISRFALRNRLKKYGLFLKGLAYSLNGTAPGRT